MSDKRAEAAEVAIIQAILADADAMDNVAGAIGQTHFESPTLRRIFSAIEKEWRQNNPIDPVSIDAVLLDHDRPALQDLAESAVTSANVSHYCKIVYTEHVRRQAIKKAEAAAEAIKAADDPAAALDALASSLTGAATSQEEARYGSDKAMFDVYRKAEALAEARASGQEVYPGILTPWPKINSLMGGWKPRRLHILGADTGVGKSAAAFQAALAAAKQGKQVAYFSGEMGADEFCARAISAVAAISPQKIEEGTMSASEWGKVTDAISRLQPTLRNLTILYGNLSPSMIQASSRRMQRAVGLDFVVVDYIQLCTAGYRPGERVQELEHISQSMKELAMSLDIPVLALSQFSRNKERQRGGRARMDDLHGSSSFAKDADVLLLLAREADEAIGNPEILGEKSEMALVKGRNCRTGMVPMRFDEARLVFVDISP